MIEGKMTGGRPQNSDNGQIKNIMKLKTFIDRKISSNRLKWRI